jgi:hypothetical protein
MMLSHGVKKINDYECLTGLDLLLLREIEGYCFKVPACAKAKQALKYQKI